MKNYILTLCTLLILITVNAQDFVGKDASIYLNATVKIEEKDINFQSNYKAFYLQFDTLTKILTKKPIGKKEKDFKPFQTGASYSQSSNYSDLVGMEFKVTGIYEEAATYDFDKGRFFVLALSNETIGTIFYEYDSRYKHKLEFIVVGGLNFPEGYWCEKIKIEKDKFNDKTSFYSPDVDGFMVMKFVENNVTSYYLSVHEGGITANVNGKGLYLLFDDGTKISKENANIDVKVGNNGGFVYSAFVKLTYVDLEILKSKKITDNRLYIYDGTLSLESANLIQEYLKCLLVE